MDIDVVIAMTFLRHLCVFHITTVTRGLEKAKQEAGNHKLLKKYSTGILAAGI